MVNKITATRQKVLIAVLSNSSRASLHFSFGTSLFWYAQCRAVQGLCPHVYLAITFRCPSPGSEYQCHILGNLEVVIAEGWKQEMTCAASCAWPAEGIMLGVVGFMLIYLYRLWELHWELPTTKEDLCPFTDFTTSPAQRLGAASQKCDPALALVSAGIQSEQESHTLPACWYRLLCCSRKPSNIFTSPFFSILPLHQYNIICDLSSFLLGVYAQHLEWVDWPLHLPNYSF